MSSGVGKVGRRSRGRRRESAKNSALGGQGLARVRLRRAGSAGGRGLEGSRSEA
jgi:hypothetical protein